MQEEGVAQIVKQPGVEGTRKRKSFWAQCERCESWRRLPKELQKQVDAQEFWSVLLLPMSTLHFLLRPNSLKSVCSLAYLQVLFAKSGCKLP